MSTFTWPRAIGALAFFLATSFCPIASASPQSPYSSTESSASCGQLILPSISLGANLVSPALRHPFACLSKSAALLLPPQSVGDQSKPQSPGLLSEHRFWDRQNDLLFAAVGASRALDYASTLNFRRRGRNEIFLNNDIVDNHPAFAAIEAGGTAVSIGVSYLFHRYHHHRLERWVSIIHASAATTGAVRNYCLKTAHP